MLARGYQVLTGALAGFAVSLQSYITTTHALSSGKPFFGTIIFLLSFFTILTNLLVAVTLTLPLVSPKSAASAFFSKPGVRSAVTVYIAMAGISYNVLLRHLWNPEGAEWLADELLHDVVPFLYILHWILHVPKGTLRFRQIPMWMLYPTAYVVFVLERGNLLGQYPLPGCRGSRVSGSVDQRLGFAPGTPGDQCCLGLHRSCHGKGHATAYRRTWESPVFLNVLAPLLVLGYRTMTMRARTLQALIAALFLVSASRVESTVEGQTKDHEHPGVSDATAGEAGHHHGDSDDHHENPDDPCHHHVVHCCCGHTNALMAVSAEYLARHGLGERLNLPVIRLESGLVSAPPFHVPIA